MSRRRVAGGGERTPTTVPTRRAATRVRGQRGGRRPMHRRAYSAAFLTPAPSPTPSTPRSAPPPPAPLRVAAVGPPHPGWAPGAPQPHPFPDSPRITLDPSSTPGSVLYPLVISAVVPRPIALVSSQSAQATKRGWGGEGREGMRMWEKARPLPPRRGGPGPRHGATSIAPLGSLYLSLLSQHPATPPPSLLPGRGQPGSLLLLWRAGPRPAHAGGGHVRDERAGDPHEGHPAKRAGDGVRRGGGADRVGMVLGWCGWGKSGRAGHRTRPSRRPSAPASLPLRPSPTPRPPHALTPPPPASGSELVINIISEWMLEAANHTCGHYDRGVNEFELSGLTPQASTAVRPPRVAESAVQLECVLQHSHDVVNRQDEVAWGGGRGAGAAATCVPRPSSPCPARPPLPPPTCLPPSRKALAPSPPPC